MQCINTILASSLWTQPMCIRMNENGCKMWYSEWWTSPIAWPRKWFLKRLANNYVLSVVADEEKKNIKLKVNLNVADDAAERTKTSELTSRHTSVSNRKQNTSPPKKNTLSTRTSWNDTDNVQLDKILKLCIAIIMCTQSTSVYFYDYDSIWAWYNILPCAIFLLLLFGFIRAWLCGVNIILNVGFIHWFRCIYGYIDGNDSFELETCELVFFCLICSFG